MLHDILQRIKEFPEEPFISRVCTPEQAEKLFNWNDVSELIRTNENKFELINEDNRKISVKETNQPWHGTIQDKSIIYENILDGLGFVIINQSYYNKSMNKLSADIEQSLKKATDIHVYGAYDGSGKSFTAHSDPTSNIIVQLDGTSLWRIYAEKLDQVPRDKTHLLTEVINQKLYPGMVAYIPNRTYHKCEPLSKRLSLSFAIHSNIHPPTRKEYFL